MRVVNNDTFIAKARAVHGDKYDYSMSEYKGFNTKMTIVCKTHGSYIMSPLSHINKKRGCYSCMKNSKILLHIKSFIEISNKIHNNFYDYSLISTDNYENRSTSIPIVCPTHGVFYQSPDKHLSGQKCKMCSASNAGIKKRLDTKDFVKRARLVHGEKFDYSKTNYVTAKTPVVVICPEHGEFNTKPTQHLSSAYGCPNCGKNSLTSSNKSWICDKWLSSLNNTIYKEYPIPNLSYVADAYDKDTNTIFEFYGCFWHGCPKCYDPNKINTKINKTMEKLYQKTMRREKEIQKLGYKIVSLWECDYRSQLKEQNLPYKPSHLVRTFS